MRYTRPDVFLACLALVVVAMAHSGCKKRDPVRLGFMAGLTGRSADLGVAGRNGALLAVEEINAAGGIKGQPVQLVVRNDGQNPETAKTAAGELIKMKVAAVIGPMTSSIGMAIVPLFNASDTLLVSPSVTTTELTGKDDNFIRVISPSTAPAVTTARWQFERCGRRRVAAIYDLGNSSYSENWLKEFRGAFQELGGSLVKTVPFRSAVNAAFSGSVQQLAAARPDLVLIIANAVDAALICQQIRKLDGGMPIAMAEWASTERLIELAGAASEGVYVSQIMRHDDPGKRYRSFLNSYRARFGHEPGFGGMTGYEAAQLTLQALARKRPGEFLKEAILAEGRFQGVQQEIAIDRFGDAHRANFVTVIRNGAYLHLE